MLKLSDIMTRDVVTVTPQTSLRDAVELFTAKHISGAPVLAGNSVVGVVSAADVLAFISTPIVGRNRPEFPEWNDVSERSVDQEAECENVAPASYFTDLWSDNGADTADRLASTQTADWSLLDEHTVDEVMTLHAVTLAPNDPVLTAAELMRRKAIHRIVVMERDRLVGIVSALDVARAVAETGSSRNFAKGVGP
ncbi:MAG: CBS domain-containing protein [Gemmatimonadaceae bacterium]